MPDAREVDGVPMHLNGIGLRTFSWLGIPIYVAGLYLEHHSSSPDEILHSPNAKLLEIQFLRDVDAGDARKAWQESFEQNCEAPCSIDPADMHLCPQRRRMHLALHVARRSRDAQQATSR
jgi:hypothetical protein